MSGAIPSVAEAAEALFAGTGEGVKVAIVDSGVETSHPSLAGLELADDVAVTNDGLMVHVGDGGGRDVFGHGTAIASILHSLVPRATIGSFRVLNERLGGRTATIREGVRQAMDRGYHILNCSFGCRGEAQFVMSYKEWIDEAYLKGVHVVAACNNFDFSVPEWPGYFPTVVTVNMARSQGLDLFYGGGHLVEFAAAGENVDVAWSGGARKTVTGSSYAAPMVSALLARLLSVFPELGPLEAKSLLHRIAKPIDETILAHNVVS